PFFGRTWADLRRQARAQAVAAAQDYLRQAGEPIPDYGQASLLMAGHQPELFHPGVWVKNFALHGLAHAVGATPTTFIVATATAKASSVRRPVLTTHDGPWPQAVTLPYDQWNGEVPYEDRTVNDEPLFVSLPDRATPLIQDWGFVPLLPRF